MSVSWEYDTTIGGMIKDLQRLALKHGVEMKLSLPSPGFFDPHFEGRNSKLTAKFSEQQGHVLIVEKDIKDDEEEDT